MLLSSGKNKLKYLPIEPETSERITKSACDKNSDVPSCRYFFYILLTGIFTAIYSRKGQIHNLFPLAWYCVRLL